LKSAKKCSRSKSKKRRHIDRSGIFISLIIFFIGAGFLLSAFQTRSINTFIFGVICILLGLHHYLREMIIRVVRKD